MRGENGLRRIDLTVGRDLLETDLSSSKKYSLDSEMLIRVDFVLVKNSAFHKKLAEFFADPDWGPIGMSFGCDGNE